MGVRGLHLKREDVMSSLFKFMRIIRYYKK